MTLLIFLFHGKLQSGTYRAGCSWLLVSCQSYPTYHVYRKTLTLTFSFLKTHCVPHNDTRRDFELQFPITIFIVHLWNFLVYHFRSHGEIILIFINCRLFQANCTKIISLTLDHKWMTQDLLFLARVARLDKNDFHFFNYNFGFEWYHC